jgi:hypothetical protein
MIGFGIFMIVLGLRKHEQKGWISKGTKSVTIGDSR